MVAVNVEFPKFTSKLFNFFILPWSDSQRVFFFRVPV